MKLINDNDSATTSAASPPTPATAAANLEAPPVGAAAPPPVNIPANVPVGAADPPVAAGVPGPGAAGRQVHTVAAPVILAGSQVLFKDANGNPVPTVTMTFPHAVRLTVTHAKIIDFKAGIQEVPIDDGAGNPIADHPYLVNNGVTRYAPQQAVPNPITARATQPGNAAAGALGATPTST